MEGCNFLLEAFWKAQDRGVGNTRYFVKLQGFGFTPDQGSSPVLAGFDGKKQARGTKVARASVAVV